MAWHFFFPGLEACPDFFFSDVLTACFFLRTVEPVFFFKNGFVHLKETRTRNFEISKASLSSCDPERFKEIFAFSGN